MVSRRVHDVVVTKSYENLSRPRASPSNGKSAAYGRALADVGDLRSALADVLAFAIERLGHGDNGGTNGQDH
jgi:hypothetical protein